MTQKPLAGESSGLTRREFVKMTVATSIMATIGEPVFAAETTNPTHEIPKRQLGRTGEKISCIGLGGYHIGQGMSESESIHLIRNAVDRGITFLDNCWDYNDGESERRMGKALRDGYRERVFLMTKIDGRDKQTAAKQIDESLQRLQTDHLDLMQLHEIIRMEDPDRAFAKGGAMEALMEGRKAGKFRYIGFTGHKDPQIHLRMLETAAKHGFHFDTVQMPLNVMDAHFRSFEHQVLPKLIEQGIGVLGMKSMGGGVILKSKIVKPVECLQYALNLPTAAVITGIDSPGILDQAIETASTFKPLTQEQVASLLSRTAEAAKTGEFELFKTASRFDGTAQHPEWLG
jgi:aryl-alcohol dehydrogenase-like predicted oxidoreductase